MAGRLRSRSWPVIAARVLVFFFALLYACNFCGLHAGIGWQSGMISVVCGQLQLGLFGDDEPDSLDEYNGIWHTAPLWCNSTPYYLSWRERIGLIPPTITQRGHLRSSYLFQGYPVYIVPLWLCAAVPATFLFVSGMRARRSTGPLHCRTCGYSLVGNTSGRCPECGTAICDRTAPTNDRPVASR